MIVQNRERFGRALRNRGSAPFARVRSVGGMGGGVSPPPLSFGLRAQTSIVPENSIGSGTPTFTRASTAYQTDFEGKYNLALANESRFQGARRVATLATTLNPASYIGISNATVTTGISDPDGGTNAWTLTATSNGGGTYDQVATTGTLSAMLNSVWLRRRTGSGTVNMASPAGVNNYVPVLTSSWQRFASGVTSGGAGFARVIQIALATSGDAVDVYHPMLESVVGQANQNPSEFLDPTVQYGANVVGVKYFSTLNGNTVASNVVTEATGAAINSSQAACANGVTAGVVDAYGPKGYLEQGAKTELLGATAAIRRTMTDVGWVNGGTVTVGSATGADGVATAAASLTFGAVAATNTILFTTVLGAAVRTYIAWVRRKTGTGTVQMTVDGGVGWTTISPVAGVYLPFQLTTANAANPIVGFKGLTNADAIEVDFNGLRAGTFYGCTPIPINVTTAADVLSYPLVGNASFTQGTLYAEVASGGWSDNIGDVVYIGDGGLSSDITGSTLAYPHLNMWDGTNEVEVGPFLVDGTVQKVGGTWGGATMVTAISGAAVSGSFNGALGTGTAIYIGTEVVAGFDWEGTIRYVEVFSAQNSISQIMVKTS